MENFAAYSYALVFAMLLSFSCAQQFQFSKVQQIYAERYHFKRRRLNCDQPLLTGLGWTPGKRSAQPQTGAPVFPTGDNSIVDASLVTNTRLVLDTEELVGLWSILKPNIVDQTMGISVMPSAGKGDYKLRMTTRK